MSRPQLTGSAGPSPSRWRSLAAAIVPRALRRPTVDAADEGSLRRALDAARHYRHVYYSAPVALVSCDAHGTVLRWNDRADAWFAGRLQKGRVNALSSLLGHALAATLLDEVGGHGRYRGELRLRVSRDGFERVCDLEASMAGDAVEVSLVDVSERSRLAETLEHIAYHDALTDQLNRRGLERVLDARFVAGATAPGTVMHVDIDRFKAINDLFGHGVGDAVVVELARRMRATLPESASVGRLAGDEFMAVLPDQDLDAAHRTAIRLLEAVSGSPYLLEGLRLEVEASIGVIEVPPGMRTREAIALADDACAQAKRSGGLRIAALRPDASRLDELRETVHLGSILKTRLPVDRLELYSQPIVALDAAAGPAVSFEVLLRTRADDGRIEGPGRLLEVAERHGAMAALDRFVLERTVEHLSAHPDHAAAAGFFAVNLSGASLGDERFLRDALAILQSHPGVAARLCLEITESVAVGDMRAARRFIGAMVETGAAIALDDFGAGYTSFAYLKELPASLIKIDGQFVVGLDRDPRQRGIVQAIARLAHELGMRCLAEWVEDEATLRALLRLDVDLAQGFLFARPRPIGAWLEHPVDLSPLRRVRGRLLHASETA